MRKFIIIFTIVTFSLGLVTSTDALAQNAKKNSPAMATTTVQADDMTYGEVRKINKEAGKVTLKHGRIENLDMPGMTMVFRVKDKRLLDNIQEGEKVKFKAVNDKGKLTIIDIKADE